jgi:hypothetical protein
MTPNASPSSMRRSRLSHDTPPAKAIAMPTNASRIPSHCSGRKRSLANRKCTPSAVKIGAV